jgi:phospholipase/lecithinase/hemolysin
VAAISSQVSVLQGAGVQHILVNGVGDVGGIPETLGLSLAAQADRRALSINLSTQLFAALDSSIYTLDVVGFFDQVNLDPTLFGLPAGIDVTGSCLTTGTPPNCGEEFAFFDTVHLALLASDGLWSNLGFVPLNALASIRVTKLAP